MSEFDNITSKEFSATVDYGAITSSSTSLPIKVVAEPSYIELRRITPENVEYLIETY